MNKRSSIKTIQDPLYVGNLGDKWQFPSDHLPVGVKVNGVNFLSWNVLNTAYLKFIESNNQGLRESLIMKENVSDGSGTGLTKRERRISESVIKMIQEPIKGSVIALQEVGLRFYTELVRKLKCFPTIKMFSSESSPIAVDRSVFLYDSRKFSLDPEMDNPKIYKYKVHQAKAIMVLSLRDRSSGCEYRIIQTHAPGGPKGPSARKELAEVVMQHYDPKKIMIVMGDMNHPPEPILWNFAEAARAFNISQPFHHVKVSYFGHVNTKKQATRIDNIFVSGLIKKPAMALKESDFFLEVKQTAELMLSYL